jgi:hypothetical protein
VPSPSTVANSTPPWSRLVFVLAVMAGVILMHSLVLSPHTPGDQVDHHVGTTVVAAAEVIQTPDPVQNCDVGSECSDAWVLHVCVAILAVVITGAAASTFRRATPLLRVGLPRGLAPPRVEQRAARHNVHPLLTELSVLRL